MKKNKNQKSKIEEYVDLYKLEILYSPEDEAYLVNVPELPGCKTHGATQAEAMKMGYEAIEVYLESLAEEGKPLPIPLVGKEYSGKIMIRTTPSLHRELVIKAEIEDKSLNEFIEDKLKKSV